MKPIKFKGHNVVYAENQPEYRPLASHKTSDGVVTSCWGLTWRERFKIFFTGKIWWSNLTFNNPLQPQLPSVTKPEWIDEVPPEIINEEDYEIALKYVEDLWGIERYLDIESRRDWLNMVCEIEKFEDKNYPI